MSLEWARTWVESVCELLGLPVDATDGDGCVVRSYWTRLVGLCSGLRGGGARGRGSGFAREEIADHRSRLVRREKDEAAMTDSSSLFGACL